MLMCHSGKSEIIVLLLLVVKPKSKVPKSRPKELRLTQKSQLLS